MFFSNQHYKAADNHSSILAYSSLYKKEGSKVQSQYDFQLKFDLPRTSKKLKIVIEKEQNEISKALTDDNIANAGTTTKDGAPLRKTDAYTAGANYTFLQSKYFASFIYLGIRLDLPINPFAKMNLQKDIETDYFNIELTQKFMLYRQEGFQEITQASFNKKWNDNIQTNFNNTLVWTDQTDLLILRNNLILYQKVGDEKRVSYSLGANAKFSPSFYYDGYDASISYRQLVFSKWLYGSLTLGADFPKSSNFNDEKFIQVRLEMYFKD